jgi:hypothetical protein
MTAIAISSAPDVGMEIRVEFSRCSTRVLPVVPVTRVAQHEASARKAVCLISCTHGGTVDDKPKKFGMILEWLASQDSNLG